MIHKSTCLGRNVEYFECEKLMDCSLLLNFFSLRIHVSLFNPLSLCYSECESSPDGKASTLVLLRETEAKQRLY